MKVLRTSFNQFVREKVIHGVDDQWPDAEDMPLDRMLECIESYSGYVEYQESDHDESGNHARGNYFNQGPMGFGPPPTGTGAVPFKSFLSNKIPNTYASELAIKTGDPQITPHVKVKDLHYSGAGCTFSIGQAIQYRYTSVGSELHQELAISTSNDHKLITMHGLNSSNTAVESTDNDLHFVYKPINDKKFQLYIQKGDGTVLNTPQTFNHYANTYGRVIPVHFVLKSTRTGEFRVDNAKIIFEIPTSITSTDGSAGFQGKYVMPTGGVLGMTIRGLTPYNTSTPYGMRSTISRLTNIAINDNNTSPCLTDVELPPFIHGVSCTPIRRSNDTTTGDWEFPSLVNDPFTAWTSFSENNPTVSYGLSAVMDNQTYDTRGVATSALDSALDIYITKQSFTNRIDGAVVTDNIEAINVTAYNAATFDGSDFQIQVGNNSADQSDWKRFPGLYDDPDLDSHVSFLYKNSSCDNFQMQDFNSDLIFKLKATTIPLACTPTTTTTDAFDVMGAYSGGVSSFTKTLDTDGKYYARVDVDQTNGIGSRVEFDIDVGCPGQYTVIAIVKKSLTQGQWTLIESGIDHDHRTTSTNSNDQFNQPMNYGDVVTTSNTVTLAFTCTGSTSSAAPPHFNADFGQFILTPV